jgi:hypothetical protein
MGRRSAAVRRSGKQSAGASRLDAWVIDRVEVIRASSVACGCYDRVKEKTVVETVSARLVVAYTMYTRIAQAAIAMNA